MTSSTKLSWQGAIKKENQVISNYILSAERTSKGKTIKCKGTMENQMQKVIELSVISISNFKS